ncbi:DNA-binding CsgD family transcriptional regulator/tetratricopeptide (TPR) repeat protein [Geodermatophilus daqingensis]|uniref:DNA-binding CsgD family transcriptional regulator/tetratricopeptide (TPR) repeat protein n=1 Tax=Petropleomorpha daqingensis TaxID=2026353 RepID=A0A853CG34_9ACTN|nr:DNA-binding CsgD family transcriptional regulator/tetratricopeptide (TPR) repeat protein [Petropleomorpha daqingensis]
MDLVGRESDLATLDGLVSDIGSGGRAVVLRGDPGVGKSALLAELDRRVTAAGWRVLRSEGVLTEQRLPLAGLEKLIRPVLRHSERLRPPQREVLETAFGLREGDAEFFRIALAALDLLCDLAADRPLAVLVDDGHWLDRASAEVLSFIGRRIAPEPILCVVCTRPAPESPFAEAGLPEVAVGPLGSDSAAELLDAAAPDLDPARRRRVLEAAQGNPLALLELPQALRDLAPGTSPDHLPLTARLERAFADRAGDLPERTRQLLVLSAVNDSPRLFETLAAAERLSGSPYGLDDLDAALRVGLVQLDSQHLRFRHPLVRSALVQSTSPGQRQRAHAALAGVVGDDPDRRAWHLGLATVGADDAVAAELEATADRAFRRGAALGAVDALERSARLSGSATQRSRRLLRAAEIACETGRSDLTRRLLDEARPDLRSTSDRLRYAVVEDLTDESLAGGAEQVQALVDRADAAGGIPDVDLALRFLMRAATRCWHLDFGSEVEQRVLDALDRLPVGNGDPRRLVIRAYTSPLQHGVEIAGIVAEQSIRIDDPGDLLLLGYAAACVGASREADTICARAADRLRELGRLTGLAEALSLQAWAALRRGRFDVVETVARECAEVAADIRRPIPQAAALAALAAVAGIRGDTARATELATRAEQLAVTGRNTIGLAVTQVARGLTAATAGRPDEAFEQLEQLCSRGGRAHQRMQACWALGSFAEVAAQSGHGASAKEALDSWENSAPAERTPGVDLALRSARALLATPAGADEAYRSALALDWSDRPFDHGRLLLAYGRWLRHCHRVVESRMPLRAARDAFVRTGAQPWVERARRELRAAGAGSTAAPPGAAARLSPQELQIARLVAEGLGNKEIGQRLYLSHRTVGSHLYRIFPKLGVSSRAQVARVLDRLEREQHRRDRGSQSRAETAVDGQPGAGDVAGTVAREENQQLGDLLGGGEPARGAAGDGGLGDLLG